MLKAWLQFAFTILCFVLHACNARHIHLIQKGNIKVSQPSNKNEKKSSISRVSLHAEAQNLVAKDIEAQRVENGGSFMENTVNEDDHGVKVRNSSPKHHLKGDKQKASVSWKLPKKIMGEQQQGFKLDYDQPEMHPPEHN